MTPKLASFGDSSYICSVIQRNYEAEFYFIDLFVYTQSAAKPAEF